MAKGDSEVKQTQEINPEAQKYVAPWLDRANALYSGAGPTVAPVAGFSPEQVLGQAAQFSRGVNGSPLNAAAGGYLQDTIGGKYLNSNPWLQDAAKLAAVGPDSAAASAGRYGSGAHYDTRLQAIAPVLAQSYANERGMQQQAAGMAPQLAQQDYVDIAAMNDVGQQRQALAQQILNQQTQTANMPFENVNQMLGLIYGYPGRTSTSTQPGPSTGQTILGGLLGLGGLGLGLL